MEERSADFFAKIHRKHLVYFCMYELQVVLRHIAYCGKILSIFSSVMDMSVGFFSSLSNCIFCTIPKKNSFTKPLFFNTEGTR